MATEIERKFLVKGEYKSKAYKSYEIIQGYLCRGCTRTVRVRIRDNQAFITIKGPSRDGGLSRFEWEKEITVDEAKELMTLCEYSVITKRRFLVKEGKHVFEVDEFYGDNEGLTVAEVELGAVDEEFERPDWLGVEVTGDRRYSNASLSRNPFKYWL